MRAVLAAAHGVGEAPLRKLTVVKLSDRSVGEGWGECSALNTVGYSSESAQTAFELLSNDARLDVAEQFPSLLQEAPMAMASLEMAEYDMRLKAAGLPLAELLGVDVGQVAAGAAIGIGSIAETEQAAGDAHRSGYRRVKLKVVPSDRTGLPPASIVQSVAANFPDLEIQVDGNGSFDRSTASEVDAALDAGATVAEQPFAPAKVSLAAALVRRGATVMADEAATDQDAIKRLMNAGACTGVVVKSSRLGGLYPALELLNWCSENGLAASAGGMQESGLGRAALAALAGHPACTVVGDVSPARRWLAQDPWADVEMDEESIVIPTGPGVAAAPDPDLLERFTVQSATRTLVQKEGQQ